MRSLGHTYVYIKISILPQYYHVIQSVLLSHVSYSLQAISGDLLFPVELHRGII